MTGTVLIVDDEPKDMFLEIFKQEGLDVRILMAENGEEALQLVQSEKPDVIILDLLMPKVGGEALLHNLKERGLADALSVIIMTGFNDFEMTKRRIESEYHVDFYVDKPIDVTDIVEKVRLALDKRKSAK